MPRASTSRCSPSTEHPLQGRHPFHDTSTKKKEESEYSVLGQPSHARGVAEERSKPRLPPILARKRDGKRDRIDQSDESMRIASRWGMQTLMEDQERQAQLREIMGRPAAMYKEAMEKLEKKEKDELENIARKSKEALQSLKEEYEREDEAHSKIERREKKQLKMRLKAEIRKKEETLRFVAIEERRRNREECDRLLKEAAERKKEADRVKMEQEHEQRRSAEMPRVSASRYSPSNYHPVQDTRAECTKKGEEREDADLVQPRHGQGTAEERGDPRRQPPILVRVLEKRQRWDYSDESMRMVRQRGLQNKERQAQLRDEMRSATSERERQAQLMEEEKAEVARRKAAMAKRKEQEQQELENIARKSKEALQCLKVEHLRDLAEKWRQTDPKLRQKEDKMKQIKKKEEEETMAERRREEEECDRLMKEATEKQIKAVRVKMEQEHTARVQMELQWKEIARKQREVAERLPKRNLLKEKESPEDKKKKPWQPLQEELRRRDLGITGEMRVKGAELVQEFLEDLKRQKQERMAQWRKEEANKLEIGRIRKQAGREQREKARLNEEQQLEEITRRQQQALYRLAVEHGSGQREAPPTLLREMPKAKKTAQERQTRDCRVKASTDDCSTWRSSEAGSFLLCRNERMPKKRLRRLPAAPFKNPEEVEEEEERRGHPLARDGLGSSFYDSYLSREASGERDSELQYPMDYGIQESPYDEETAVKTEYVKEEEIGEEEIDPYLDAVERGWEEVEPKRRRLTAPDATFHSFHFGNPSSSNLYGESSDVKTEPADVKEEDIGEQMLMSLQQLEEDEEGWDEGGVEMNWEGEQRVKEEEDEDLSVYNPPLFFSMDNSGVTEGEMAEVKEEREEEEDEEWMSMKQFLRRSQQQRQ